MTDGIQFHDAIGVLPPGSITISRDGDLITISQQGGMVVSEDGSERFYKDAAVELDADPIWVRSFILTLQSIANRGV